MKNVCLNIAVQTPRSLASPERVKEFCDALRSVDPAFVPRKYGLSEPLKSIFDLHVAEAQLTDLHKLNGSSMIFKFGSPLDGMMYLNTSRGPRVHSNGLKVQLNYASMESRLQDVNAFIALMFESLGAAYACATLSGGSPYIVHIDDPKKNWGEINGREVAPWNPSGLQSLPGICWINVFGPEYVHFIGEGVLASLPAYQARTVDNGRGFWLQPTERPEEMLTEEGRELAAEIKRLIGRPRAFYAHDPRTPSFRAVYDVPPFDFSEIRPCPQST